MIEHTQRRQALFLSRTAAHLALIQEGKNRSLSSEYIARNGHTRRVYARGQYLGWAAFMPCLPTGYITERDQ